MKAKKIKSIAITAMMAFASLSAIPASATSILDKMDVNGDGGINASDAYIINLYVNGSLASSTPEIFDINSNGIVDVIDYNMITRYITTGVY